MHSCILIPHPQITPLTDEQTTMCLKEFSFVVNTIQIFK